ncbi:MAG: COQ9 family protein [Rhodospirillales bacterium]|nr:COQ9 family protein [Rhodospirillales bacterium]
MTADAETQAMGVQEFRDRVLVGALTHVPFDGWTERSLGAGAVDAGMNPADGLRAFPTGALEAVEHFSDYGDRLMIERLEARDLGEMKVRERIALAVRSRIEVVGDHREAVRRALSYLALPQNGGAGLRCTYRTVNGMWYAVGDRSTDFSFYTRRGLLSGVYASSVLYWLTDLSDGYSDTWEFVDRRIDGVLKIMTLRRALESRTANMGDRLRSCMPAAFGR